MSLERLLATDPAACRCYEAVTDPSRSTLDGIAACFSGAEPDDERLYRAYVECQGSDPRPLPAAPERRYEVPSSVVEGIRAGREAADELAAQEDEALFEAWARFSGLRGSR